MADLTPQQFAAALLRKLGIHQTPGAIQALVGWENAEGGNWHNQARFNPLNTTQNAPGAGNTGSQGNIKVYRNWQQGLDATAQTLRNGRYGGILNALQAGNPGAVASAIDRSPWGTHGPLVYNAIKGAPRVAGVHAPSVGGSAAASSAAPSTRTTTTTTPGVDNSGLRRQALASFLLGSGTPDPTTGLPSSGSGDILDFALQMKQLADVPGQATTAQAGRTAPRGSSGGSVSTSSGGFAKSHSPLLELIHNTGSGSGFAVKDGKKVNGPQFYSGVWAGHRTHVHVAAGPKTIVDLGKLAQRMGLHVGENPHFGGVNPVHVPGSYHYKGEAIDVSGDDQTMNRYAAEVERLYRLHG